ncbi:MAG: inorganic phosphate transporter [Desulfamplus sp.]|nr:inorganic phosphate transporter [Desulfamplus sp.]
MSIEFYFIAVCILIMFAAFDLVVGVTNDAVNFLNSSIGSKAAPFKVIMVIASLGILAGVTFSGGMMEVARKGIFNPQFFTMPDLIAIFIAVMLTDILLLDLFNTHGLPTSTTVSIVFELLGAAVAISVIKIAANTESAMALWDYINTAKALTIVFGILLSIVVAFFSGAAVQFVTRSIFTFDYMPRLKKYGSVWGGFAMASITFFILIKGSSGATFMTPSMVEWIHQHSFAIICVIFVVTAVTFQILLMKFQINILKPIILVGTFALAMAFAANDLVNFIGVPLAGLHAYLTAVGSSDPMNITMEALGGKVHTPTAMMLLAGSIMVITLWVSKKAKTVTETEISLGQQDEGMERFESIWLSRKIVTMADSVMNSVKLIIPEYVGNTFAKRLKPVESCTLSNSSEKPSFDLLRAAVNLMVASAVVSFATSFKLPLSTTYVTFMVAMGTSFSDQAWGRESAVYRVTGVLTVVGGWFMTAVIAFAVSFVFATIIFHFKIIGIIGILSFAGFLIWKNHVKHKDREKEKDEEKIFSMDTVENFEDALSATFDHLAYLLGSIRDSMDVTFEALFREDINPLKRERKRVKQFQIWTNTIIANIFKVLRHLQQEDEEVSYNYYQIIRRMQKISDNHRDTVARAAMHVSNSHKGLLPVQIDELHEIKLSVMEILKMAEISFHERDITNYHDIAKKYQSLRTLIEKYNANQIGRIRDNSSKTRLSILFYGISGNCLTMMRQNIKLLEIFNDSFKLDEKLSKSYIKLDKH